MKQLYKYQQQAVERALNFDRFLLALDMGLGKTLCALKWLKEIQQKNAFNTLILCDSNKTSDWVNECVSEQINNIIDVKNERSKLAEFNSSTKNVFIVSYALFRSLIARGEIVLKNKINLIIDESQALKNHRSKISQLLLRSTYLFARLLLLSGDPISTGYENLYTQMKLLECFAYGFTYSDFLRSFCITQLMHNYKNKFIKIVGYVQTDLLLDILKRRAIFIKTEDVLELPQKRAQLFYVKKPKEYNKLEKNQALLADDYRFTGDSIIKFYHGLRMLCSGVIKTDDQELKTLNNNKLDYLRNLIESSTFNFSLFYNYKAEAQSIKELCEELDIDVYMINGEINEIEKVKVAKKRFIVLIQFMSGARGIDGLQLNINHQIYYSPTYSGELFKQSLKRVHRLGQEYSVCYYFLIAKNSIEEDIYKCLQKAKDYTIEMFKNRYIGGQNEV